MTKRSIRINVPTLARVEGEGALEIDIRNGKIAELQLRIYEPPRFFEKFLEGREFSDIPDVVARICGICPVAYQMSAVQAIESIFEAEVTPWIRDMRRVMYCGEWIQSHSLHIHLLAAPDFLGFNNVMEMTKDHAEIVQRGLRLQALGNQLIALFGARSVHPIGVRVGGFSRAPDPTEVSQLVDEINSAIPEAEALLAWVSSLNLDYESQEFTSVAMRDRSYYPMNTGRLISNTGLELDIADFESRFAEQHVPHSTALHCTLDEQPYLVGPLARINLNQDRLPARLLTLSKDSGIEFPSANMFHSIVARAVEINLALHEASRILSDYSPAKEPQVPVIPKAGVGFGCTEAPRGILWHRYELNDTGHVVNARIVPPTSQNQGRIEANLRESIVAFGLDQPETDIRLLGEKVIRNYDPCISCATHFLKLKLKRDEITLDKGLTKKPKPRVSAIPPGKTQIIGVGSPFGSDTLGLDVVNHLIEHEAFRDDENVELIALDRPATTTLLERIEAADRVILIDAIQMEALVDEVINLDGAALVTGDHEISSHQLGVSAVMSLADSLGLGIDHVQLIGLPVPARSTQCWSKCDITRVAAAVLASAARLDGNTKHAN